MTRRLAWRSVGAILTLVGILPPTVAATVSAGAAQSTAFTTRERQVYAAVLLNSRVNGRDFRGDKLIVRVDTVDPRRDWWWDPVPGELPAFDIRRKLPRADPSTITDFLRRNESVTRLDGAFDDTLDVTLLPREDYDRFARNAANFWEMFYAKYPRATGVIRCSRIGFNTEGTQAVVYVGRQSDTLAGAGHIMLLQRDAAGWHLRQIEVVWLS